ncbi:P-loop containing nucleoside triphosphate hydrolase protein, partial [Mycena crocata]
SLNIDEGHCISEWGNDVFRPEYSKLHILLARMPSGLPVVVASATMPRDVILEILAKLRLRADCARVSVSNAKPNVALSVRILQHPQDTFADLITLFPKEGSGAKDFPQTLMYAEGRMVTEKMQDFFRDNSPDDIEDTVFEFYHRFIDEKEKVAMQEAINNGNLRGVPATDALGMGMDFKNILRVILWMCPKSFLSLIQKIGRCGRITEILGEAILYVTSAAYMCYEAELEILKSDMAEDEDDDDPAEPEQIEEGQQMDREAAIDDETETETVLKRKAKKAMSVMEARDRRFLLEYIVTKGCRRIPWNKFFGNESKPQESTDVLPYTQPPNARCCDNCNPDLFPVETVAFTGGSNLKSGRRRYAKTSEEIVQAVTDMLLELRDTIAKKHWPNQYIVTGKILMSDQIVASLAARARNITSVQAMQDMVRW